MTQTPRLSLPFLNVGQSQKEFFHNEALQTLDMLVGGCVEGPPQATPPASPEIGAAYLVAAAATGAWSGKADQLAAWTDGGWRFSLPVEGLRLLDRSSRTMCTYSSGAWEIGVVRASTVKINGVQVVSSRQPAISVPTGGTVIDVQARNAIASIVATLQAHGLTA